MFISVFICRGFIGVGVQGVGFRVRHTGFSVRGLGFRVQGLGFSLGCGIQDLVSGV